MPPSPPQPPLPPSPMPPQCIGIAEACVTHGSCCVGLHCVPGGSGAYSCQEVPAPPAPAPFPPAPAPVPPFSPTNCAYATQPCSKRRPCCSSE